MGKRNHNRLKYAWLAMAPFAGLMATDSYGVLITWNNADSTDFNDSANWTGGVPVAGNVAAFTGTPAFQPDLTANATLSGLSLATSGWTLSTANGSVLTLMNTGNTGATSAITTTASNAISSGIHLGAALSSNQYFFAATGATLTLDGVISGGGATNTLNYSSTGTYAINNANTYEGSTAQTAGSLLIVGHKDAFGTGQLRLAGSGGRIQASVDLTGPNKILNNISISSSPTINSGSPIEFGGTVNLGGAARTITNNNTAGTKFSGEISNDGGGGLIFAGGGLTTLSASNLYSGTTQLREGTVVVSTIGNGGDAGNLGTGSTISMGNSTTSGILRYNGAGESTNRSIALGGTTGGAVFETVGAAGPLTIAGNFVSSGAGIKTVTLRGDTDGNVLAGNLIQNSGTNVTNLTKSGSGSWLVTGNNAISGTVTIVEGQLGIAHAAAAGTGTIAFAAPNGTTGVGTGELYANSAVTLAGLAILAGGSSSFAVTTARFIGENSFTFNGNFTGNGNSGGDSNRYIENNIDGGTLTLNGNYTTSGTNTNGNRLRFQGSGDTVVNGIVNNGASVTVSLTYSGTGSLTLAGANVHTRGTVFSGSGTVNLNNAQAMGLPTNVSFGGSTINNTSGAAISISSGNGITFDGNTTFYKSDSTALNNLNLGTGAVTFFPSGVTTRSLTISGTGTTLSAEGAVAGIPDNRTLNVSGTGELKLNGTVNISSSSSSRTLSLGGNGKVIINGAVVNGSTSTGSALTYNGTGILTLNGTNTYGGATNVAAGTVLVNGTQGAGTVNVNNGAVLGGTGTVAGVNVTAASNSTVSPGNADTPIGALNTANFTLRDNNLAVTVTGSANDKVNVTGTVNVTNANLVITAPLESGIEFEDVFFIVINDAGEGVTGTFNRVNGTAKALTEGTIFRAPSQQPFKITYLANAEGLSFTGGNDVALMAVPEPSCIGLIGLAAGGLLARRRRASTR